MSPPVFVPAQERRRGATRPDRRRPRRGAQTDVCRDAGAVTLEESILGTLSEIAEAGSASCPVCESEGFGAAACSGCGSVLE
jgi:DnaJ-class molecular chaperone